MTEDIKKPDMAAASGQMEKPKKKAAKGGIVAKIIMILIVVVIILGGLYFVDKYTSINIFGVQSADDKVTVTDWQAVFLSNGQVYFGKIVKQNDDTLILRNIYYLQVVQQPLQATQTGEAVDTQNQQQQNQLSLVKLGNELHGPQDEMHINPSQVLFTEQLKSDSKVVDAINRYLQDQQNQ